MALDCDLDSLIQASRQYLEPAISEQERQAIEIYLRVQSLIALGGADYSDPTVLQEAAKEWQVLAPTQLRAIEVEIGVQNAGLNGATIDPDVNALSEAARCFLCLPAQTKEQLLVFLRCAINEEGAPE